MNGIWCMTTRNREEDAKRFVEASNITSGVKILWCDGCNYSFKHDWWQINSEHIGIGAAMNKVYEMYPQADFYGWLADDLVPWTDGWDVELAKTAGHWNVASCNDLWLRGKRDDDGSPWVSGAICMGGDLVRAMGWWSPPGMFQLYIDTTWVWVAKRFGLLRYRDDVIVEHLHPGNHKRKRDKTDEANPQRRGDRDLFRKYTTDGELVQRVESAIAAT